MMEGEPEEGAGRGRLRVEDRRGRMGEQFINPEDFPDLPDPEEEWKDGSDRKRGLLIMAVLAALVVFGGVGVLVNSMLVSKEEGKTRSKGNQSPGSPPTFVEKSDPEEIRRGIEVCLAGFMNAGTHAERCRYLIGGDDLEEVLEAYYGRPMVDPPESFGRIHTIQEGAFGGVTLFTVLAKEKDRNTGWFFNVLPTQSGMAIDWESSVGYGERSWEEFSADKPTAATRMRVFLEMIPYDPQRSDHDTRAYCELSVRGSSVKHEASFLRGGETGNLLAGFVTPGKVYPVFLELSWAESGAELRVQRLIHNYWIDMDRYWKAFGSPSSE